MADYRNWREKKPSESLFNSGIAKLERIHILRIYMHEARLSGNWNNWNESMKCIRSEVNERLDLDELELADNFEKNINMELEAYNLATSKGAKPKYSTYKLLSDYCLFLAKIEYKYGYSMPDKPTDNNAINI